jgi:hypothetical protein
MANDAEIGRNVTRLRGGGSQKDLADAMRKKGFRWSQATVWAVEKGERPLRLTEAEALGQVFGIQHQMLLSTGDHLDLTLHLREFGELLDEIHELAYSSFAEQRQLAVSIDLVPAGELDEDITIDVIRRTAVDAAVEGLARAAEHHRGLLDVNELIDGPVDRSARQFTEAFDAHVRDLVEGQTARSRVENGPTKEH